MSTAPSLRLFPLAWPLFLELLLGMGVGVVGTVLAASLSDASGAAFALSNHVVGKMCIRDSYRPICSNRLLAFERYTDRAADTVLVIANPSDVEISDTLMVANSKLMDSTRLVDVYKRQAWRGGHERSRPPATLGSCRCQRVDFGHQAASKKGLRP